MKACLAFSCLACAGEDPASPGGGGGFGATGGYGGSGGTPAVGGGGSVQCATSSSVVKLQTDDGVELEADFHPTGEPTGPAVVLLHMIPPANDRTNYPKELVDALVAQKIQVLNVDRRGAGASGGVAEEAYLGDKGKLDAKAAVRFLTESACPADPFRVGIVGASNGTTTALDYAVYAGTESTVVFPSALVFLTAGSYTENQHKIDDQREVLDPLPILFVFSKDERDFSILHSAGAPSTWRFQEYDPGDHGTKMLTVRPESIDLVTSYLKEVL